MHLVYRKTAQRMPLIIELRVCHLCDSFQKRCKITTFLEYMQIFNKKNGFLQNIANFNRFSESESGCAMRFEEDDDVAAAEEEGT